MTSAVLATAVEVRAHLERARAGGAGLAVVPTMGALHAGHQALIRRARQLADEVAVTIFVNPTQFGPNEDFARYPRQLEADVARATEAGATLIFAPAASEMYPPGDQTRVSVGTVAEGLCGATRPGHFVGVATVVSKFFALFAPATFLFGQKDYQQLKVLERVATDLLFPIEIAAHPIVREADGLALSSRNVYLTSSERRAALGLPAALTAAMLAHRAGERRVSALVRTAREVLGRHALDVEYVELRTADTLVAFEGDLVTGASVMLLAARSGTTRLIDNAVLGEDPLPQEA